MPWQERPERAAATSVVPLPHIGSSTVPPGGQHASTSVESSASGFWVGHPVRSKAMLLIAGMSRTSVAFFVLPASRALRAGFAA